MQALEAHKHESQRALNESRRVAEIHVAELEQQVDNLKSTMEKERSTASATKEEYQRLLDKLETENTQLKEELDEVSGKINIGCECTIEDVVLVSTPY